MTNVFKKQHTKGTSVKKKATKSPKTALKWFDHARKLPVALFHTTVGPIIGHSEKAPASDDGGQFRIRLWAPAVLQVGFDKGGSNDTTMRQRVVFQPLALIETHIDLSTATPLGKSPPPDSVVPGYEEYFEKFVNGTYAISRVVAKIEQGAPHVVEAEPVEQASSVVADDLDQADDQSNEKLS